jgi:hypothetical protein
MGNGWRMALDGEHPEHSQYSDNKSENPEKTEVFQWLPAVSEGRKEASKREPEKPHWFVELKCLKSYQRQKPKKPEHPRQYGQFIVGPGGKTHDCIEECKPDKDGVLFLWVEKVFIQNQGEYLTLEGQDESDNTSTVHRRWKGRIFHDPNPNIYKRHEYK